MKIAIVVALFLGVAFLPSILIPGLEKEKKAPETIEETKIDRHIVNEPEGTREAIESESEALITESEVEEPGQLEEIGLTESEQKELTRNLKLETRNSHNMTEREEELPQDTAESEVNPQSAIRNPQSAIRNPQSAIRNPQSIETQPLVVESEMRELKRATTPVVEPETEAAVTKEVEVEFQPEKELKREAAPVLERETEAVAIEEIEVELQPKRKIPEEVEETRAISLPAEAIEVELIPSPPPKEASPPEKEPAVEEKERVIEVSPLVGPTLPEVVPERRLVLALFSLLGDPANFVLKQLGQGLRETNLFKVVSLNLPLLEESLIETTRNIAHLDGVSMEEAVDIWGANVAITGKVVSNTYFSSMVLNVKLLRLPDGEELLSRTILTSRDRVESEIEALIEEIKDQFPVQQGRVIQVEGDYVILDLGYLHGLREGMELLVYRVGGLLKESATSSGEIVGARTDDVAIIRVDKVTDKSARAGILELFPVQEIQVGDRVISR